MIGRVSVALCTFDGAAHLEAQLTGILDQTASVDEIVVGDDGSRDGTMALLRTAAEAHPSIRVLPPGDRLGVTANFERTIASTTGDIVILSDQDDVWHADRVAAALAAFEADPDAILVHADARIVDGMGVPVGETLLERLRVPGEERARLVRGDAFGPLLRRNLVTGATLAFRRSLLAEALPFPPSWVHDEWLAVIAASRGGLRLLDRPLIDYRIHDSNQIGAERTTAATRLARLREPRGPRNARLLARAEALVPRVPSGEQLREAEQKLHHEQVRSAYPTVRVARIAPVLREWRTGRYARYGRGFDDVVRDLIQPA